MVTIGIPQFTIERILEELKTDDENQVTVGYLFGRKEGDGFVLEGVHVLRQEPSGKSATSIAPDEVLRAMDAIKRSGKAVLGLTVYHGSFKPFESEATAQTRKELAAYGSPTLSLIINKDGEYETFHDDDVELSYGYKFKPVPIGGQ